MWWGLFRRGVISSTGTVSGAISFAPGRIALARISGYECGTLSAGAAHKMEAPAVINPALAS
jgi:hypothetical protein